MVYLHACIQLNVVHCCSWDATSMAYGINVLNTDSASTTIDGDTNSV